MGEKLGASYSSLRDGNKRERAYPLLNEALAIYQKTDAKRKIEKTIAKKKLLTA